LDKYEQEMASTAMMASHDIWTEYKSRDPKAYDEEDDRPEPEGLTGDTDIEAEPEE
jgi:hypothetical protein